jgi:8-oxo-dGTP diphosphatase
MKTINVVAAVIQYEEQYLCVQRGENNKEYIHKKFEFPGGKVEDGESSKHALQREIREELQMDIEVHEHLITVDHTYPDFRIIMETYRCECRNPLFELTEHLQGLWLKPSEMHTLDWAAADLPIVALLTQQPV